MMFEDWQDSADYRTLFRVHRDVRVEMGSRFPSRGAQDEEPLWAKIDSELSPE